MIYAHINIGSEDDSHNPPEPGFYERNYDGLWLKDYWDGKQWYWTQGGKLAKTQNREWRVKG